MVSKKNLILLTAGFVVLGALLGREYPKLGMITVGLTIGVYVALGAKNTIEGIKNLAKNEWNQRIKTILSIMLVIVLAGIIIDGRISYFAILLLLGIDYMIYVK